jgi:hypothetical protein
MKYIYYHLSDPRSEFYNIPLGMSYIHNELSGLPDGGK